jgi:hypothetical protein
MKIILGTSNISQRPPQRDLKNEGARLTEALARRVAAQAAEEAPEPKPALRPVPAREKQPTPAKAAAKQLKPKSETTSSRDPLAWAKAAAAMRGWKPRRAI